MHPLVADTLVAERVRDRRQQADAARQARQARQARRDRLAAIPASAHGSGRPFRLLATLGRTGSGHPRPAR